MKKRFILIFSFILVITICFSISSCNTVPSDSVEVPNNILPRYVISESENENALYTSFLDDDCYYYLFYLGSISRVPLQKDIEIYQYSGNDYTKTLSTTVSVSTTVSQMISFTSNNTIEYRNGANVSGILGGDAIGASLEFGLSGDQIKGTTISRSKSFENAVTYSEEQSNTTTFSFTEESEHGYYRYMLFGDVDVYGVLIKDIMSGKYYTSTYEVVSSQYYDLDYSENSRFDDEYDKLVFDTDNINFNTLPIPTNYVVTTVVYDSGYSEKKIDASYEYTLDTFDISELATFMNSSYTLDFHIEVKMKEVYASYQEIYLCNSADDCVAKEESYEYGGSGSANKSYGWATFDWEVRGDKCTDTMKLRYGAHGDHSDDWYRAQAKVIVSVKKNWLPND